MTYVPHTWVNGETITAEKMNNLVEGIGSGGGGGVLVAEYTPSESTGGDSGGTVVKSGNITKSGSSTGGIFTHTWLELAQAIENDIPVFIKVPIDEGNIYGCAMVILSYVAREGDAYVVAFEKNYDFIYLGANSPNDYPIEDTGDSGGDDGNIPE